MIVAGRDKAVAAWMGREMGVDFAPPFTAFGVTNRDGFIVGAFLFNNYETAEDIHVSIYGPRAMTRAVLRYGFGYVFDQLNCKRLTAQCRRRNRAMRKLMERLGFTLEGVKRHTSRHEDVMIYGMLRGECKWLGANNGKHAKAA